MGTSRDPARSRPLSANVKRLMRLSRAAPKNGKVIKVAREFGAQDYAYCHKQGQLFMEAAWMGFSMEDFAPLFMDSQLAGVFDVSFAAAKGMENDGLSNLLRIPLLLKSPETIVEALYWIDDIIRRTDAGQNKSMALTQAYEAERLQLPPALAELPDEPNGDVDALAYAYWLGFIYRCECLLHEESSRMVYGAFDEALMRSAYKELLSDRLGQCDLMDSAPEICARLDRLLVESIWPARSRNQRRLQELETHRSESK